jgi:GH24 family phage-related lysozyme (muramidase)
VTYRDIAKAQLKVDEGIKSKPYRDSLGKWTIGVGRNLDDRRAETEGN